MSSPFITNSHAASLLPRTIKVDQIKKFGCYRFVDPVDQESVKENFSLTKSPLPPHYLGKKARLVSCNEYHHFQTFWMKRFKNEVNVVPHGKKFCDERLKWIVSKISSQNSIVWSRSLVSGASVRQSCFMSGDITPSTSKDGGFFAEDLFTDFWPLRKGN